MDMCENCEEQEAYTVFGGRSLCLYCYEEATDDDICEYCGAFIDEEGCCDCEREM